MSSIHKEINRLFEKNSLLQVLVQADPPRLPASDTPTSLISYLNPIHPSYIHIIEDNESLHLNSLTNEDQFKLIDELTNKYASHIIFGNQHAIPESFLQQNKVSIAKLTVTSQSPFQYMLNKARHIAVEQCSIHSSMVVVYGQGILITGDSGAGKSTLLLALLNRDHLWVADDAPLIYRNYSNQIYVTNAGHLSEYIHTKEIGAINADQTFGKSKRISNHKLAAIIHLGNNVVQKNTDEGLFAAQTNAIILGNEIPKWCIHANEANKAMLVEIIAKQLILHSWGDSASETLVNTHNSTVMTKNSGNTSDANSTREIQ